MNAKQQIQEALKKIMDDGDARACRVYKDWHFASPATWGWHYTPFNGFTQYLGRNLQTALGAIDAIADSREHA